MFFLILVSSISLAFFHDRDPPRLSVMTTWPPPWSLSPRQGQSFPMRWGGNTFSGSRCLGLHHLPQERNLLSVAYKNVVGARRSSWRVISSIEQVLSRCPFPDPTGELFLLLLLFSLYHSPSFRRPRAVRRSSSWPRSTGRRWTRGIFLLFHVRLTWIQISNMASTLQVEKELRDICNDVLNLLDKFLIAKVGFLTCIPDHLHHLAGQ